MYFNLDHKTHTSIGYMNSLDFLFAFVPEEYVSFDHAIDHITAILYRYVETIPLNERYEYLRVYFSSDNPMYIHSHLAEPLMLNFLHMRYGLHMFFETEFLRVKRDVLMVGLEFEKKLTDSYMNIPNIREIITDFNAFTRYFITKGMFEIKIEYRYSPYDLIQKKYIAKSTTTVANLQWRREYIEEKFRESKPDHITLLDTDVYIYVDTEGTIEFELDQTIPNNCGAIAPVTTTCDAINSTASEIHARICGLPSIENMEFLNL